MTSNGNTENEYVIRLLDENGYQITNQPEQLIVQNRSATGKFFFILSLFIGILLLTFGAYYGFHFSVVLMGLVFIGIPLIYERWKYPNKIIINNEDQQLILKTGFSQNRAFRLSDISSLEGFNR